MRWMAAIMALMLSVSGRSEDPRLSFDVASVRPSTPGQSNGQIKGLPGGHGYTAQNINLKLMISLMYKVPMRQIEGGPEWLTHDTFDVEARTETAHSLDELQGMYRNLLAERFKLKLHTVTREGQVYALTVDPGGLKMKRNDGPQDFRIPMNGGPQKTVGVRVPMRYLCWWLGGVLQADGRPVIDKTGLQGNYDFTLSYAPVLPPDAAAGAEVQDLPPLFDAVRDQLGLRLHPEKGPVEFLVIDSVEKPSEN